MPRAEPGELFERIRDEAREGKARVRVDRELRREYHEFRSRLPWCLFPRFALPALFGRFGDHDVPTPEDLEERLSRQERAVDEARADLFRPSEREVSRASS